EPATQPELPGGLPASAAVAAGCTEGDHGGGAQAGPDRVPPGALRPGVCQGDGGGVRGAGARAPGEAVTPSGEGGGLGAGEAPAGGSAGGGVGAAEGGSPRGPSRTEGAATRRVKRWGGGARRRSRTADKPTSAARHRWGKVLGRPPSAATERVRR